MNDTNSKLSHPFQPLDPSRFRKKIGGKEVKLFSLKNKNGLYSEITNFGGRVVSLWVPDKNGHYEDIVLGYDHLDDYLKLKNNYYGAIVGRYANRIKGGQFQIGDQIYQLTKNEDTNHIHGGIQGFHNQVWEANQLDEQQLELKFLSPDGEEGYPGNLEVTVLYTLTNNNELKITYRAATDQPTPVNLTNHSFFNLKGAGNGSVNDHILTIHADRYLPIDKDLIPRGHFADIQHTPLDFRVPATIGSRIEEGFEQLEAAGGYDHNWVLNQENTEVILAAEVVEPTSGRTMNVYTNEPGIQFFSSNFGAKTDIGKQGKVYKARESFCLETQHLPNSPNEPDFPDTILKPGEEYYSVCSYRFASIS